MNTYYIYYQRKQYFLRESRKYILGLNTFCRPGNTMGWGDIPFPAFRMLELCQGLDLNCPQDTQVRGLSI